MTGDDSIPATEPARGAPASPALLAYPGIEQLRAFLDGIAPRPPVARLTGRRIVSVGDGEAAYALPVSRWLVGPKGTLHPGMLAYLADAPLFAAIYSTVGPGTLCTTAEVSTTFLDVVEEGDELLASARMLHRDSTTGLSEATITNRAGALVGHATSRCFLFPPVEVPDEPPPLEPAGEEDGETPDPYLRPVEGPAPPPVEGVAGLDILRRVLAGELPRPPVDHLTGIQLREAEKGRTVFVLRTSEWHANELGTVYGGLIALLAGSAGSAAVQTLAPAGTRFRALDMKLNVIRPVHPDGGELVATGTVVHGGRRLAIANAEVADARGRRVAFATGTTALMPPGSD